MAGGDLGGGCKQQDAHEFFLFVLEMLISITGRDGVISTLFTGELQSEVICSCCGAASTTSDHFTNISVDIPPPSKIVPPPILPRPNMNSINGKAGAAASRASKQLVGAAKAAHVAKMNKLQQQQQQQQAVAGNNNNTNGNAPHPSAIPVQGEESSLPTAMTASDSGGNGNGNGGVARPSPPIATETTSAAPQASGIDAEGAAVVVATGPATTTDAATAAAQQDDDAQCDTATFQKDTMLNKRTSSSPSPSPPISLPHMTTTTTTTTNASPQQHPALAKYLHWPGASVMGCLRRFVRPERLGSSERWGCPACGVEEGAVKQMSIRRLPPILVMHAKRFEHSGGLRGSAKKLDTYLRFPMEALDMSPYLTSHVLKERHGVMHLNTDGGSSGGGGVDNATPTASVSKGGLRRTQSHGAAETNQRSTRSRATTRALARSASAAMTTDVEGMKNRETLVRPTSTATSGGGGNSGGVDTLQNNNNSGALYDLYAVVCHRGTFQGGHYIAYVKAVNGQWYVCDDAYVAPVSEEVVSTCQAYMLFYAQQALLPHQHQYQQNGHGGGGRVSGATTNHRTAAATAK